MSQDSSTTWATLVGADMREVIAADIFDKAESNIGADVQVGDPFSPDLPKRSDAVVAGVVGQVRAAIQAAGRFPLSVNASGVPRLSRLHVLNLAAWLFTAGTSNVQMVVVTERGDASPLGKAAKLAEDHIEELRKGGAVDMPSDPTGIDYLTAADSTTNPLPSLVKYSDIYGDDTDYARGYYLTSTGQQVTLPVDDMNVL